MKLKKYEKNPIIAPNPANAWENLVTCNPGVIYDDGRFYMLYRAAGDDQGTCHPFGAGRQRERLRLPPCRRFAGIRSQRGRSRRRVRRRSAHREVRQRVLHYLRLPRPCPRAVLDFRARRGASAPMRSLCAGRHGAESGKYGACRDVRLPEFPPAGAAYVARARRSGRDPFPGENRREVRHDAPSQTVRGRTLRGEIPFDLAEVLRRPAGMGGPSPAICLSPAAKEPGRRRSAEARRRS